MFKCCGKQGARLCTLLSETSVTKCSPSGPAPTTRCAGRTCTSLDAASAELCKNASATTRIASNRPGPKTRHAFILSVHSGGSCSQGRASFCDKGECGCTLLCLRSIDDGKMFRINVSISWAVSSTVVGLESCCTDRSRKQGFFKQGGSFKQGFFEKVVFQDPNILHTQAQKTSFLTSLLKS